MSSWRKVILLCLAVVAGLIIILLCSFRFHAFLYEDVAAEDAAPAGRFVDVGTERIFIQELGPKNGTTVIFIHGTGAWSEIWRSSMVAVSDHGFRAVAIDMPPFGFSTKPADASYDTQAQARRIIGVMTELNATKIVIVGHSFGSRAAMEAVMQSHDRVHAVVLVDAALGLQSPDPKNSSLFNTHWISNLFVSVTATNPLLSRTLLKPLIADSADATDEVIEMLQAPSVVEGTTPAVGDWLPIFLTMPRTNLSGDPLQYRTLTMPVLIIWGELDTTTPLSQGEYLASIVPGSKLLILNNTGHIPHLENPSLFNTALVRFFEETQ